MCSLSCLVHNVSALRNFTWFFNSHLSDSGAWFCIIHVHLFPIYILPTCSPVGLSDYVVDWEWRLVQREIDFPFLSLALPYLPQTSQPGQPRQEDESSKPVEPSSQVPHSLKHLEALAGSVTNHSVYFLWLPIVLDDFQRFPQFFQELPYCQWRCTMKPSYILNKYSLNTESSIYLWCSHRLWKYLLWSVCPAPMFLRNGEIHQR